jgi:subtilase family serine protease
MRRVACFGVIALVVLGILGLDPGVSGAEAPASPPGLSNRPTCPGGQPADTARCNARVVTDANGKPLANRTIPLSSAKTPAQIQSAYKLPSTATNPPSGPTVAIVDAYDDPAAASDLAVYRKQYGLPPCTTTNGCLRKVNQRGGTTMPRSDEGWATEIYLDLDAVSAACPNCKILLVEADSPSFVNLGTAVDYAATQPGVVAISNSYGGSETHGYDGYYNHPGIAVTASTGDSGYGVQSPAAADTVVAVGGTKLVSSSNARGWSESAWSGAGSGCSSSEPKPAWLHDASCARRMLADVSAVADPNTGLSVYDSIRYAGNSGWQQYGGTSLSAPIIAAVYALAHDFGSSAASYTYTHSSGLFDASGGSNGTCSVSYFCNGVAGYDGPTGLGTPNGFSAF